MSKSPIILALDTADLDTACRWIEATNSEISTFKAGLEFFLVHGFQGIAKLREAGTFDLFLDLKLHDIPNTVGQAVKSVLNIAPKFLTVHASGGAAMVAAAAQAGPDIDITAVTILTSLSEKEVKEIGFTHSPLDSAVDLAMLATQNGAKAIVCSPLETAAIRSKIGRASTIITPGVRPAGSSLGDQNRVMTPSDAIAAGSNYLVIGRPITSLVEPDLMRSKAAEINQSIFG